MLQSFANATTAKVWRREKVKKMSVDLQRQTHRKLLMMHRAERLADLCVPPGNRLEKLSGDRAGQYSIRINSQFRICFRWTDVGPVDVEITDYH